MSPFDTMWQRKLVGFSPGISSAAGSAIREVRARFEHLH
jgi:hypothetical protein